MCAVSPQLLTNINCSDAASGTLYNLRYKQTYVGLRGGSLSSEFPALETYQNAIRSLIAERQQHAVVQHTKAGNLVWSHCLLKTCEWTFHLSATLFLALQNMDDGQGQRLWIISSTTVALSMYYYLSLRLNIATSEAFPDQHFTLLLQIECYGFIRFILLSCMRLCLLRK